ncbi:MAG: hypothetical protein B6I19_06505, partial [Bacteroidetes bacterium 4572_114]
MYNPDDQEYAFSVKEFDNSPLNRVMKQAAPGEAWKPDGGHEVEFQYSTNTGSAEVYILTVTEDNELKKNDYYDVGKLFKTITIDENTGQSIEYKDISGRVVCTQVHEGSDWLRTYYAYDDFGLLRYVIPPKAYASLTQGGSYDTFDFDEDWILSLCYYYEYDNRKRMKIKRLPGAYDIYAYDIYMVYNKRDQLVLTQDGKLRQEDADLWLFMKYDVFNRPVMTGIYDHETGVSQEAMQAEANSDEYSLYEQFDLAFEHGYTNDAFPKIENTNPEIQTLTYYDNYGCLGLESYPADYAFQDSELNFDYLEDNSYTTKTKGFVTAVNTKVLEHNGLTVEDDWLLSINYYDIYGRTVQVISDNHLGGIDIFSSNYNFTGELLQSKENHD